MLAKILDILRIVLTALNIYFILGIVTNTAVSALQLAASAAVFFLIGFLLYRWSKTDWRKTFRPIDYFAILLPFIYLGFFWLNYFFACCPETKTYQFSNTPTTVSDESRYGSNYGDSTTILMENGDYQDFYLFRTFPDYHEMRFKTHITMTTETGLFGLLVLKDYHFSTQK